MMPAMQPPIPKSDSISEPGRDCPLCPRLVDLRLTLRTQHPDWFNAPVPSFGPANARLLIAGLAPGVRGANRTGRPFTGDYAGTLLYATLLEFGFATGRFDARPDDGLTLIDCRISNAVRCVPPSNKPIPAEIATCRRFFLGTLATMPNLHAIIVLGRIAHETVLTALDVKRSRFPFAHGAAHEIGALRIFDSYHCSRLNTNTGVLTPDMFRAVFAQVREYLDG
jgi:uracil-DNA glycosylase family 4